MRESHNAPTNTAQVQPKLTIATADKRVVRCFGRLQCICGYVPEALDFADLIAGGSLVCSGCHNDLVSIRRE